MDLFTLLVEEFYNNNKDLAAEDLPEGFGVPITPIVSYLCFNEPLDLIYAKDDIIEESTERDALKKAKKEMSAAKKGKTSKETGTVYKLTKEQKRALKYIKKKYGKEIINEVKKFRKNFLAPYQVIKSNLEKSKSVYPKEVFGMSKEEFLRTKKRAEEKILNMRSNTYSDLNKEYYDVENKYRGLSDLSNILDGSNINPVALRNVFEKYKLKSTRFDDNEFISIQNRVKNADSILSNLVDKITSGGSVSKDEVSSLKEKIKEIEELKKDMRSSSDNVDNFRKFKKGLEKIEDEIDDLDIPENIKGNVKRELTKTMRVSGENLNSRTFSDEYEMFLLRQRIVDSIKDGDRNKYVDEYKYQLGKTKERLLDRKSDLIGKMAKERSSKNLTDDEKKIYELRPGRPKDSDKLEDYILKIKEQDFFEPIFFHKSEKMKEAEKNIDAEIKRFERSLQAKMEEKDFRLLKKYRLINNLITIKNLKNPKELFGD